MRMPVHAHVTRVTRGFDTFGMTGGGRGGPTLTDTTPAGAALAAHARGAPPMAMHMAIPAAARPVTSTPLAIAIGTESRVSIRL